MVDLILGLGAVLCPHVEGKWHCFISPDVIGTWNASGSAELHHWKNRRWNQNPNQNVMETGPFFGSIDRYWTAEPNHFGSAVDQPLGPFDCQPGPTGTESVYGRFRIVQTFGSSMTKGFHDAFFLRERRHKPKILVPSETYQYQWSVSGHLLRFCVI